MAVDLRLFTNPQDKKDAKNPGKEKLQEMKEELAAKRKSLFDQVETARQDLYAQQRACNKARHLFTIEEKEFRKHNETELNYTDFKMRYNKAKNRYSDSRSAQDLKLMLLQSRTDDFVRASRIQMLDCVS